MPKLIANIEYGQAGIAHGTAPRQVAPFRISAVIAWLMRNYIVYTTRVLVGHPTVPINYLMRLKKIRETPKASSG